MLSHACGPLVLWSSFGPLVVLFIFSSFFVFSKFLNQDYFGFGVWIFPELSTLVFFVRRRSSVLSESSFF